MTTPPLIAPDPLASLAPPVRWLITRAAFDDEALVHVDPSRSMDQLYGALTGAGLWPSALRLLAGVLPARESIWWAWVSARHATQLPTAKVPSAAVHAALVAIEQWIVRPDDAARRAAWDAGQVVGTDTPVGMVCAAVFLSGTSVAPAHLPAVPPPPDAAMPLVAGAIILAAASQPEAPQITQLMAAFAAQGLEIIKRLGGWDAALEGAYATHQRQLQEQSAAAAGGR